MKPCLITEHRAGSDVRTDADDAPCAETRAGADICVSVDVRVVRNVGTGFDDGGGVTKRSLRTRGPQLRKQRRECGARVFDDDQRLRRRIGMRDGGVDEHGRGLAAKRGREISLVDGKRQRIALRFIDRGNARDRGPSIADDATADALREFADAAQHGAAITSKSERASRAP